MLSKKALVISNILTISMLVFVLLIFKFKEHDKVEYRSQKYPYFETNKKIQFMYKEIKELYSDDELFLQKLESSNLAWLKAVDADFDLKFPHADEASYYYGSSFPMCSKEYKESIIARRLQFLAEWINKTEEGDVCSGSVKFR